MNPYYVYILECADKSYYTGVTNNIDRRLGEHFTSFGQNTYVSKRLPAKLVYCCACHDIKQAIAFEKQIKGWSRKKKEALINEDFELLKELSKSYSKRFGDHSSHGSTGSP